MHDIGLVIIPSFLYWIKIGHDNQANQEMTHDKWDILDMNQHK